MFLVAVEPHEQESLVAIVVVFVLLSVLLLSLLLLVLLLSVLLLVLVLVPVRLLTLVAIAHRCQLAQQLPASSTLPQVKELSAHHQPEEISKYK
jgi:hypothetical protein